MKIKTIFGLFLLIVAEVIIVLTSIHKFPAYSTFVIISTVGGVSFISATIPDKRIKYSIAIVSVLLLVYAWCNVA
jgi:nicotinamide riboside transporter PnuC